VACRASRDLARRLARDVAARPRDPPHLRGDHRGGPLLRLGRRAGAADRRPADRPLSLPAPARQHLGRHEQGARRAAHGRRPDGARGDRAFPSG